MTDYESNIGKAIDLLRNGFSLPFPLRRELQEDGYDVLALEAFYQTTK